MAQDNSRASRTFSPMDAGYIPVNQRIETFKEKYPEGSLQSEIVEFGEDIVILKAYAYRTPDDQRPGIGHSQMPIPGKTNFTRDSEVENAETSAWGRALAAIGIEVKAAIATQEEVRNKQEDPTLGGTVTAATSAGPSAGASAQAASGNEATPAQKRKLMAEGRKVLGDEDAVRAFVQSVTRKKRGETLTKADMSKLFDELEAVKLVNQTLDDLDEGEEE